MFTLYLTGIEILKFLERYFTYSLKHTDAATLHPILANSISNSIERSLKLEYRYSIKVLY